MLPEMLQIEIPNEMASEMPENYTNMKQHVPEAFKKNEERKIEEQRQMQYEDDQIFVKDSFEWSFCKCFQFNLA